MMMTRDEIRERFLSDSAEHGKAYSNGDYEKANELHKKLHDLYNQAKEQNQVDVFSGLLNDEDENVKLWAAIFTLKLYPEIAEKILLDLARESRIKMTAETTLHLWKEGKLDLL